MEAGLPPPDMEQQQVATAPRALTIGFEEEVVEPVAGVSRLRKIVGVGGEGLAPGDAFARVRKDAIWREASCPGFAVTETDGVTVLGVEAFDCEGVAGGKVSVQRALRR